VWETSAQVGVLIDDEQPINRISLLCGFLYSLQRERSAASFLDHGLKIGTETARETGDDEEADAEHTDGAKDRDNEDVSTAYDRVVSDDHAHTLPRAQGEVSMNSKRDPRREDLPQMSPMKMTRWKFAMKLGPTRAGATFRLRAASFAPSVTGIW